VRSPTGPLASSGLEHDEHRRAIRLGVNGDESEPLDTEGGVILLT
jgi:hypothetical protein